MEFLRSAFFPNSHLMSRCACCLALAYLKYVTFAACTHTRTRKHVCRYTNTINACNLANNGLPVFVWVCVVMWHSYVAVTLPLYFVKLITVIFLQICYTNSSPTAVIVPCCQPQRIRVICIDRNVA